MIINSDKITEIFVLIDEFCQEFDKNVSKYKIGNKPKRKPIMSSSEVITIMVLFHYGSFRNFKHFYLYYVKEHLKSEFPKTVSYNRFVKIKEYQGIKSLKELQKEENQQ